MKVKTKSKKKTKVEVPNIPPRLESELANSVVVKSDEPFTTVKHMANMGDIIAALASCKK